MTTYIFNLIIDNNIITLYCIKNFQTFIINITNNINNNEANNIINNNNNFNINYYLFNNNGNNQQSLFERTNCNINLIEVFQGNYNIQTINDFKYQNQNILDKIAWLNIFGRLALD